jgi:hypothetical protein
MDIFLFGYSIGESVPKLFIFKGKNVFLISETESLEYSKSYPAFDTMLGIYQAYPFYNWYKIP